MEGEAEYAFWHALVRDVCYAQIPRAASVGKHRAAAPWLEQQAGERVEDLADVLAYHYLQALELARAVGQTDEAASLEPRARRFLVLAGARAMALDAAQAEAHYAQALELTAHDDPTRAETLEGRGARSPAGRPRRRSRGSLGGGNLRVPPAERDAGSWSGADLSLERALEHGRLPHE